MRDLLRVGRLTSLDWEDYDGRLKTSLFVSSFFFSFPSLTIISLHNRWSEDITKWSGVFECTRWTLVMKFRGLL